MRAARYTARLISALILGAALTGCAIGPDAVVRDAEPPREINLPAARLTVPTPTFVPVQSVQAPQFESDGIPDASGAPSPSVVAAAAQTIRLDDDVWTGGWKQGKTYGGRSATWIYGYGTGYSIMQTTFELGGQPAGQARLSIEGMDGENAPKMGISIRVNGVEIYSGPNPLPDDDYDLATGTWARASWPFDAALLRVGTNTITITALSEGSVGQPPFMMLDYADLEVN